MRKGKFIVVEGISGSGQQVKAAIVGLHKALVGLKYDVVECANPDSGRVQELGMASMLNWPFGRTPRADFLFEGAVRTEIFKNIVEPALRQDKIVLCKQSSISSLANAWVSGYSKHFDVLRHIDKISRVRRDSRCRRRWCRGGSPGAYVQDGPGRCRFEVPH